MGGGDESARGGGGGTDGEEEWWAEGYRFAWGDSGTRRRKNR